MYPKLDARSSDLFNPSADACTVQAKRELRFLLPGQAVGSGVPTAHPVPLLAVEMG